MVPCRLEERAVGPRELKDLAGHQPVSAKELAAARAVSIRGYAQNFAGAASVGRRIAPLWAHGLPLSGMTELPQRLAEVPLDAVNAAARKYAQSRRAILLLIGDRARIEAKVRALEVGKVRLLDPEGRPVKE